VTCRDLRAKDLRLIDLGNGNGMVNRMQIKYHRISNLPEVSRWKKGGHLAKLLRSTNIFQCFAQGMRTGTALHFEAEEGRKQTFPKLNYEALFSPSCV